MATLAAAILLAVRVVANGPMTAFDEQFFVDPFNVFLVALTAFVGCTTALFSRPYMRVEQAHGRVGARQMRLYHAAYQLFMCTMLVCLLTNNIGILWVAMEGATLSTVLLVSLYRTPESIEAAWKYFILCGVGIAQALFGTILIYFAAERVLGGAEHGALLWTNLDAVKSQLEPTVLSLAFVFVIVGYGTKTGLVPLHNWLPDAHAEGPTPVSAVLSGLLLNVALYAIIRCKVLVDGALGTHFAGYMMMGFGLLTVVVSSFYLSRQKDVKRLFGYSSIEHMGLITFAFGMGGPVASFAGLLHMTVHSLTKSAIFFAVGHASQMAGTQLIDEIQGLIKRSPTIGWGLMIGTLAILGMPPFGVFTSEFMLLTTSIKHYPWATPFLLTALGVAFATMFSKVQGMVFGEPTVKPLSHNPALLPVFVHLGLVLVLGLWIPPYLADWYRQAARLIG
jgi:hydrogenase-4 component F